MNYDNQKTQSPFDYPTGIEIDKDAEYFEKHKEEIAREFQKDEDDNISIEYIIKSLSAELWHFYKKEY